jgi:DNA invertase Pin-like site-specific DNA recombinase
MSRDSTLAGPRGSASLEGPSVRPNHGLGPSKVDSRHLDRLAIVYVRQSSPQQVQEHRESTARQYALVDHAVALGWPADRVLVIDEDQGRSGRSVEGRPGFQRLLVEVGLDHVGLILGLEMSRLTRSSKDWHHLLEICAVFRTLLADQDGIYDPTDPNDRLLLGLRGTMSEVETYTMRGRLDRGRLNKARRGELFLTVPTGYVRTPSGGVDLDPDEQVRDVVRLVFDKFDELGSASAVFRHLTHHDIRAGMRPHHGTGLGPLEWRVPSRASVLRILRHPIYAGAYAYGLRDAGPEDEPRRGPEASHASLATGHWEVMIRDRLPAYITWDRHLANVRRLQQNRARWEALGAPREGPSLLGGLLVCGHCGCRMKVTYAGSSGRHRYTCQRHKWRDLATACPGLAGRAVDDLVGRQVLRALEPAALELSLAAGEDIQRERERLARHWQQRLERTRYEAERAARQYHAVDPENRLVARSLEQRWEQALRDQRQVEEDRDRCLRGQPPRLTDDERARITALASDVPLLWRDAATTAADRQAVIRHLVERVVVTVQDKTEYADVRIHWAGGYVSEHEVTRPVRRYDQLRDIDRLMGRIVEMRSAERGASEIAEHLNREGFRPPKGRATFTAAMVRQLLSRRGLSDQDRGRKAAGGSLGPHEWWLGDLARELRVPYSTLNHWRSRGWLHCRRLPGIQGRWIMWADDEELDRVRRLRAYPRAWSDDPYPPELTTPKKRGDA